MDFITLRGARTHNLANIDVELPREKLIVVTGLSGSGKSSLAFDTIFAEGQRRYVESLSTYARQFLAMMEKPDVDHIEGLSPAVAIQQKSTSHNPRSTVGTITEIHDYLRLLFARAGTPHCPEHGMALEAQTVSQMVDRVLGEPEGSKLMLLAPLIDDRRGEHQQLLESLRARGFVRVRIDGEVRDLDEIESLDKSQRHHIEAVVDRFRVRGDLSLRLAESFETALALSDGVARIAWMDEPDRQPLSFSAHHACPQCGFSVDSLEPRLFSFNNPAGACQRCDGLGVARFFDPERVVTDASLSLAGGAIRGWDRRNAYYFQLIRALGEHYGFDPDTPFDQLPQSAQQCILFGSGEEVIAFRYLGEDGRYIAREHPFEGILPNMERRHRETESSLVREELGRFQSQRQCPGCQGTRLNEAARHVLIDGHSLPQITARNIGAALAHFRDLELPGWRGEVAGKVVQEIQSRLQFLVDVGLNYLTLERRADSLSGGEAQRIRLASQIGSGLAGVMYVLDEPSIGLHQRDNDRLLSTLRRLRDLGNTVIVVEHDEDAIRSADHIIDMGPGAGVHGGEVIAQGQLQEVLQATRSLTADYLSGRREIAIPRQRRTATDGAKLRLEGATGNNLKQVDLALPVGVISCVTGVSGSGKSSLINGTLLPLAAHQLNRAESLPMPYRAIHGLEHFDKVIDIDQSPIGRTPRSNPATYTGVFAPIRELFAETPEARSRGYKPGRFSFNVRGGRCEACQGDGVTRVEMHFLPDVFVPCDVCRGQRYNRETLDIRYKGKTISEVLDMTIEQGLAFFSKVPSIERKLSTLMDVGLGYITLGQSATTLSGGEAQRIKLAKELARRDTGRTLYILDEPTTGLHFHDIAQLLAVLNRLCDSGNTIVVIEHNLDVIKTADWIVDLGPEGGDGGGEIITFGTPEQVASSGQSHTGRYLATMLTGSAKETPHHG